MAWQVFEAAKQTIEFPAAPSFFSSKKWIKLIPKTIGNRKRDCAWGCARGINTTWENLQNEKHKSGRCSFRSPGSPDWFVLFDLQIFSGGVYPPSATLRTISFSISNSFGINNYKVQNCIKLIVLTELSIKIVEHELSTLCLHALQQFTLVSGARQADWALTMQTMVKTPVAVLAVFFLFLHSRTNKPVSFSFFAVLMCSSVPASAPTPQNL